MPRRRLPRVKRIVDFKITRTFYPDDTFILNRGGTHFQALVSDVMSSRESLQVLMSAVKGKFITKHWSKLFILLLTVERILDYLEVL